jgi:hypothetical protein
MVRREGLLVPLRGPACSGTARPRIEPHSWLRSHSRPVGRSPSGSKPVTRFRKNGG